MNVRSPIWLVGSLAVVAMLALSGCGAARVNRLPYRDSFDRPRSGWGEAETETGERGYQGGAYAITLRQEDWFVWAHPGRTFEDVRIDADVLAGNPSEGTLAGVLCRHQDLDNFYLFAITSDGYYGILRRIEGGELETLTGGGQLVFSPAIKQGNISNHLQVVCQGSELSLSVNDVLLASVEDETISLGDVGVGAGSGLFRPVRAEFDNFEVTSP